MSEVMTIGEPMVNLIADSNETYLEARTLPRQMAGAEFNVAIGVSRQGHTVSYVTTLGKDWQGDLILEYMNGIGIEMCVNEGGNYEQTLINTEKLCAQLCLSYNLNPDKALKKHQDFMEKVCPARLINEGRWDEFCAAVKQKYTELKAADAEN